MAKALCGKNKKIFFPALLVPFLRLDCQCVSCILALSFRAFCGAGQPRAPVFFVALPSVRAGLPVGGRAGAFASSGEHRCARLPVSLPLAPGTGPSATGRTCATPPATERPATSQPPAARRAQVSHPGATRREPSCHALFRPERRQGASAKSPFGRHFVTRRGKRAAKRTYVPEGEAPPEPSVSRLDRIRSR